MEAIKADVRQFESNLSLFASTHATKQRQKLQEEQNMLHEIIKQGVPAWLDQEFEPSPFQDLLEKQQKDVASAFQAVLNDMRKVRDEFNRETQNISGSSVEEIVKIHDLLPGLTKPRIKLQTRLESFQGYCDDFMGWRKVSRLSGQLLRNTRDAKQVYGNDAFASEAEKLFDGLRSEFEAQPLSTFGQHSGFEASIQKINAKTIAWIESRREDFIRRCQDCQDALAKADINVVIQIPFDQHNPADSYEALKRIVKNSLIQHTEALALRLRNVLQGIRYAIKVQKLALGETEELVRQLINLTDQFRIQIGDDLIEPLDNLEVAVLKELINIQIQEKELARQVQYAVEKRSPQGAEIRLMQLLQEHSSGQTIDLRSLIINLLEQGDEEVDLEKLMDNIQALFQKNQVSIFITARK